MDRARDDAAAALGASREEIVFCGSGSEAVNLALLGAARRLGRSARVVTWAAEHQAVLGAVRQLALEGHPVSVLPVDREARADPDSIPDGAALVSIGLANNELGTLQPVADVAARARQLGALLHVDACQGLQWVAPPEADLLSVSGHKLGAGRGGLLMGKVRARLEPLLYGGPQEYGRRAGREDVAAAVAVATALDVCAEQRVARAADVAPLAQRLLQALVEVGGRPTGGPPCLPNFATATFTGIRGEDLLLALDLAGIAASSGSACASGSLDPSHVLLAAGYSLEEALGSLRLSLGYETTAQEVTSAEAIVRQVVGALAVSSRA